MRPILFGVLAACVMCAQIQDVLKAAEIDKIIARTKTHMTVHEAPGYRIDFIAARSRPIEITPGRDADQVIFIHRGSGRFTVEGRQYDVAAGDFLHIPRRTSNRIEPVGRMELIAVRVFPDGAGLPLHTAFLEPRRMPDVVSRATVAETFAKFDRNQPLHSAPNFTMNYVIYAGRPGPWESHRECVDIYFIRNGAGLAQLGGEITNPKEETPGEMRGAAVTGARQYTVTRGDMVVIPRKGAHHMQPLTAKLGYLLLKVWVE